MAKQHETRFKEKVKKGLDKIQPGFHFKTQMKSLRGVPDIVGCFGGHAVALELKVGADVEPLQTWTLRQWEKAGAYARVVTPANLEAVLADLQRLAGTPRASLPRAILLGRTP